MRTSNSWFKRLDTLFGYCLLPISFFAFISKKISEKKLKSEPNSFLVVKLCCLGDSALSLIALKSLRKKYPSVRISVLCSKRNNWIYERAGFIDEIIVFPITGFLGWREVFFLPVIIRQFVYLLKQKNEVLLDFDIYYRFTTILSLFPGVKSVCGFKSPRGIDRTIFYNYRIIRDTNEPEWQIFYKLLEPFAVKVDNQHVRLCFSAVEADLTQKLIKPLHDTGKNLIAIVPGSSENWPEKRWPPESFAQAMVLLQAKIDAVFVLIGTKEESTVASSIIKFFNNDKSVLNLCGKTTPGILISLLCRIKGMVSNDTGPMHLAALMGIPVVGLFGPTNERKWSPPAELFTAITAVCDKRPCDQISRLPDCSSQQCMISIQPEKVATTLIELLNSVGHEEHK